MKKKIALFLLCATTLFSTPYLLSTSIGTHLLLSLISPSLSIENLSLSWLGPQKAEGIHYIDARYVCSCHTLQSTASLWNLLGPSHNLQDTLIDRLSLSIESSPTLSPEAAASLLPSLPAPSWKGAVHIKQGSIISPLSSIYDLEGTLMFSAEKITAQLQALSQAHQEEGSLSLQASFLYTASWEGTCDLSLKHFPVQGIEKALASAFPMQEAWIEKIALSPVTGTCQAQISSSMSNLQIQAESEELKLSVVLQATKNTMELTAPAFLQLHIPPSLLPPALSSGFVLCHVDSLQISPTIDWKKNFLFSGKIESTLCLTYGKPISIESLFSASGKQQTLLLEGCLYTESARHPFHWTGKDLFSSAPSIEGNLTLQHFPISLAEKLFSYSLVPYIGKTIDAQLQMTHHLLSLQIATPLLDIPSMHFQLQENCLSLVDQVTLTYKAPEYPLTHLSLRTLVLPWHEIEKLTLTGICTTSPFSIQDKLSLPDTQTTLQIDSLQHIQCTLTSSLLEIQALFSYQKQSLSALTPIVCQLTLSPSICTSFPFQEPLSLKLQISPFAFPSQAIEGSWTASPLTIDKITIPECHGTGKWEKNELFYTLHMQPNDEKASGSLELQGSFTPKTSLHKGELVMKHIPTSFLELFTHSSLPWQTILGEDLSLTAAWQDRPDTLCLSLDAQTSLGKSKGSWEVQKGSHIQTRSPFLCEYTLTPLAYKELFAQSIPYYTLEKPMQLHIKGKEGLLFFSSLSSFQGAWTIETSAATLVHQNTAFPLKASHLTIEHTSQQDPWHFVLHTGSERGTATCKATLSSIENISQASIDATIDIQDMPTELLDHGSSSTLFSALFGSHLSLYTQIQSKEGNGPITLKLSSPYTSCEVEGKIQQGICTLQKNIECKHLLSTASSQALFGKNSSIRAITAPQPLIVTIQAKGFSIPLTHFSLHRLEAPMICLEAGILQCWMDKPSVLGELLKTPASPKNAPIDLWIAPMKLHIAQGNVSLDRTEILVQNTYTIALWGEIALPKDRVQMTLGIPARTLFQTLGIQKLPKDYVLKIPIQGSLNKVSLDTKIATAKIGALLLWNSKALEGALGPWGGILKEVVPPPGGEGKTPPIQSPLPWEK